MKNVILHIGLPKTGSTSLQFLLGENRSSLRRQNVDYFLGQLSPNRFNHGELYLSVLRDRVTTFDTQKHKIPKEKLKLETRRRIAKFVRRSKARTLVFSAEGLSFLRTERELGELRELFPAGISFRIFMVEREPCEWLRSWRSQILSNPNRELSDDRASTLYVGPDTWLTDFPLLKKVYEEEFGNINIFRFSRYGLLRQILEEIGVDLPIDIERYRYKSTKNAADSSRKLSSRVTARFRRSWNEFDYWWRYDR